MEDHFQLSDHAFSEQFANCTLNPQWFTHTAHLRLAFILLKKHDLATAKKVMCDQIQAFDQTFGDGTKFHKTITEAAVEVVNHFISRNSALGFVALLEQFPRLQSQFKALLLSHYSPEVLFGQNAKTKSVQPDLLAFPQV